MRIKVEGMTCAHCERAVSRAIEALGGQARVDLAAGTVDVDGVEDVAALRRAIEGEGYTIDAVDAADPARGACCGGGCHT